MLAPFLDRFTSEELDAVPFGIVQIDATGRIISINEMESALIGLSPTDAVGMDYFCNELPNVHIPELYDRFQIGFHDRELDTMFRVTYTHTDYPRTALVRMYFAVRTGTMWIFTANPDGSPVQLAA